MTKILVVDDEPNLVDLVRGYLEHEGFEVVVATDGPSAVETARTFRPDLIILDLMLPGFDVHVANLRHKLADARRGALVQTVRGVGYRFSPPAASRSTGA